MRKRATMALAAALVLAGTVLPALADGLKNILMTDAKGSTKRVETFATDAPAIHVEADIEGFTPASTLSAAWIAVDSGGAAPPNTKFYEMSPGAKGSNNHVSLWATKPTNGWPPGLYEVRIAVDGKIEGSARFRVK